MAGAIVHSVQDLDNISPAIVTGKPSQDLLDDLVAKYALDETKTLMVGDRLSTDIQFGGGRISTMLVLSGISTMSRVAALGLGEVRPTYVAADLGKAVLDGEVKRLSECY
jgi:ribonucleotide monophosphatase NagD (HAD superfamily)